MGIFIVHIMNIRSFKNQLRNGNNMKMQKHWYLGLLGLIGLYKAPTLWAAINGMGDWTDFLNVLWFLWFFYFWPEAKPEEQTQGK